MPPVESTDGLDADRLAFKDLQEGQIARSILYDSIGGTLIKNIQHASIARVIHSLHGILPAVRLEKVTKEAGLSVIVGKNADETALLTGLNIAKYTINLRNRLILCDDEREIGAIVTLLRIGKIVEDTFILLAKNFTEGEEQTAIEEQAQKAESGKRAFKELRTSLNNQGEIATPVPLQMEETQSADLIMTPTTTIDITPSGPEQSLMYRMLGAEESLVTRQDQLLSSTAEHLDRLKLFRKLIANMRKNANIFSNSGKNLRINQLNGLNALIAFLQNEGYGDRIGYFKQPTGAGKTVLFGIIARLMDVKTLVLVPKLNLIQQTLDDFTNVVGISEGSISVSAMGLSNIGNKIIISTYQNHLSKMNNDEEYRKEAQKFELIICDEAHRSLGDSTQISLQQLNGEFDEEMTDADEINQNLILSNIEEFTSKAALKLGFTATPELFIKSVKDSYKVLISEISYAEMVRAHLIKKFKVKQVPILIKKDDVEEGRITLKKEAEILERENVYEGLLKAYEDGKKEIDEKLYALATCSTIDECDKFSVIAGKMGLRCAIVTSREYAQEKNVNHKDIAEKKLLSDQIDIIVTVDQLKEGWNFRPLNAVLLGRATLSPVNIIQPVGRASRSYLNQKFAYIFEPLWRATLLHNTATKGEDIPGGSGKGEGGKRRQTLEYRKPLTFADALYLSGEQDISAVCEGWKGEQLHYKHVDRVDDFGEVILDNISCVCLHKFAVVQGIDAEGLLGAVEKNALPIIGYAKSGNFTVPVYSKTDISNLEWFKQALLRVAQTPHTLNGKGEVVIDGILCIAIFSLAKEHTVDMFILQQVVTEKIQPKGKARAWGIVNDVYSKNEIEEHDCVNIAQKLESPTVSESGDVVLQGIQGVTIRKLAKFLKISNDHLQKLVDEAGFEKIGIAKSGPKKPSVYKKSDIITLEVVRKAMQCIGKPDDSGHIMVNISDEVSDIPRTISGIVIRKFAVAHGMEHNVLKEAIEGAKLPVIALTKVRSHVLKVYEQEKVLQLEYVKLMMKRGENELNDQGEVIIGEMTCLGIAKFAGFYKGKINSISLAKAIDEAGLPVIAIAKSSPRTVNVYEKAKVLNLPYIQKRLENPQ
jgi:superfamily II DNA or RNA helicase